MPDKKEVYVGCRHLVHQQGDINGNLVDLDGESFYKISNYDQMRPFLMSLTSDSDIWMFVSSKGGLSAGRKNADNAIFPYYTDDQLTDLSENTGSKTVLFVKSEASWQLWLPFTDKYHGVYKINRNLYKNSLGNKLVFEEINHDLGIMYRYSWYNSRMFGIIKKSQILNLTDIPKELSLLDGLENLLPPGILQNVQQTRSNLANAYKKSEMDMESGLAMYSLSSNIIDRPVPSEALKATIVWQYGLSDVQYLLSSKQISDFISGKAIIDESSVRAEPGAYLVSKVLALEPHASSSWHFVIDTNRSAADIIGLKKQIVGNTELPDIIEDDVNKSANNLRFIISQADGFQRSADTKENLRHISNTLFNVMRGGIFANGYQIEKQDFIDFIKARNKPVFRENKKILDILPGQIHIDKLKELFDKESGRKLERYAFEYLPITFSRRHGDPSRPWNKFNIDVLNEDGEWKKNFEGNWRDIFQNWEALCYSFPEFTENIITLFLNASTIDGYNPYRITNKGIEWEITDPDDPWSFIGYWGDHQIIYLQKLLEISVKFHPGKLQKFIDKPFYTFANVPYRIKEYHKIVENPYDTIVYNDVEEKQIAERTRQVGADGKLVWHNENIAHASLTEKLLITLLTKLSNFVPEGGIWMNTQRPEWNDANNALVGHGLSMVTVYHINRYLNFLQEFYAAVDLECFEIGIELDGFLKDILNVFSTKLMLLDEPITDKERKAITDLLGSAGERYRSSVYTQLSGSKTMITKNELLGFFDLCSHFIDHSIRANKRSDKLYHSYNLIEFGDNGYGVRRLYPMLEGQVAVLNSGHISSEDAIEILNALRESALFREDQNSFMLYPDRELSQFLHKARISTEYVQKSRLLTTLIARQDQSIVQQDVDGNFYFNPELCNAKDLKQALSNLEKTEDATLIHSEKELILEVYESVFNHHAFTGRSGTFFGYEGLGSIYWHMNSKLLLAVQEIYQKAVLENTNLNAIEALKKHYYEIKVGLGIHKSPEKYGAFPTDPYSHTPANKGAQQPGMTGQVKEDLLSRIGELGICIKNGSIGFSLGLLKKSEFLEDNAEFVIYGPEGQNHKINLGPGTLAFTFCGIPIVYTLHDRNQIHLMLQNGDDLKIDGNIIEAKIAEGIFKRSGQIKQINVSLCL